MSNDNSRLCKLLTTLAVAVSCQAWAGEANQPPFPTETPPVLQESWRGPRPQPSGRARLLPSHAYPIPIPHSARQEPRSPDNLARKTNFHGFAIQDELSADSLRDGNGVPWQRGDSKKNTAGVYKAHIAPHWFANNTRFWYRNDVRGENKEFVLVDAEHGTRDSAFDHQKLAKALSKHLGKTINAQRLPFDEIEFVDEGRAVRFSAAGTSWKCDLEHYVISTDEATSTRQPEEDAAKISDARGRAQRIRGRRGRDNRTAASPDGKWTALVREGNVFLQSQGSADAMEIQLSRDGNSQHSYGMLQWSPDSRSLATFRIEPGEREEVYLIESSPAGGGRAKLTSRGYALPGDDFTAYELSLFDIESQKRTQPKVERIKFGRPRLRWHAAGRRLTWEQTDRGHQRFRVMEVDSQTGSVRTLIDERTDTFIWAAHTENVAVPMVTWLEKTDEIIYASERDGWRHLYLVDVNQGRITNQITSGEFVVRGVHRIDEENRRIWFHASGKNSDQDPYLIHYFRVNFDGTNLVALTAGNGSHSIQVSPDNKYAIDTYSRADMPPVHELRRLADGKFVCALERADISQLEETGWRLPEVFVAKGRDGKTDIWGNIYRPRDFDPRKKYPIIEDIYAGPHGSFVPKLFDARRRYTSLTDRGFVVVKIDGMGTANRSKAFHDVCWKNLKDAGLPDRILWIQAAAKKYPALDTSRVGIYGTSAGGQSAAAAMLFHPEFYKAAVASCGCHDNRMDKASWNEQWMGYPVGPHYSQCSNIDNAHRLQGPLMLIVGELDNNVPPESTYRFVDALIKADKDFDLIVIPGARHTSGGDYGERRRVDFFVTHLQNADRNEVDEIRQPNLGSTSSAAALASIDLATVRAEDDRISYLTSRYRADRANLDRFYSVPQSSVRNLRMSSFCSTWLSAIEQLDATSLSEKERAQLAELKQTIHSDFGRIQWQAKSLDEIGSLVPFAATIVELAEARQRVQSIDAAQLAGHVDDLASRINSIHRSWQDGQDPAGAATTFTRDSLKFAAQTVDSLRATLKEWFDFYNGYDPLFTWWMRDPYAKSDKALEEYAKYLQTQSVASNDAEASIASSPRLAQDAPDLARLIELPVGQMPVVIEEFQSDLRNVRGPRSRQSRRSTERSSAHRELTTSILTKWRELLEQLDFPSMSQDDRADFLLLENHISYRLHRLQRAADGSDRTSTVPQNKGGMEGRPIGRDGLLTELRHAMIRYTPEELIEIGEQEYAWCEAELKKVSREMGLGDDWHQAVAKVKEMHVQPGKQPELIRDLAWEAIEYLEQHQLVTIPSIARETWRMRMMSPERQLVNPFFTGGEVISVSFPTDTMAHQAKLQSMQGNNIPFARATVHHELIPGHHLQGFMTARHRPYRRLFSTPFWGEGWALYWEMVLYDRGFPQTPEDRIGFLVWRTHRCARIIFSLNFHLGRMSPQECIDFLIARVGFERNNATAEVRRSVGESYSPLYQAAYMLGGLQIRGLREELVETGKMTERDFHDAILRENSIPIEMLRAILTGRELSRDFKPSWKFYTGRAGS